MLLLAASLLIYFYAHYGFASSTMHLVSMFPPFVALLVARGAPAGLAVYGFGCLGGPLSRVDALRHRAGADVFRAGLREPPRLVEGGIRGVAVERIGLVLDWVCLVEVDGHLVGICWADKFQAIQQRRGRKSTLRAGANRRRGRKPSRGSWPGEIKWQRWQCWERPCGPL